MHGDSVNDKIVSLINGWCDRRELPALAAVLPHWLANNGLTDGWAELGTALRNASAISSLPAEERKLLKQLWVEIDAAVDRR